MPDHQAKTSLRKAEIHASDRAHSPVSAGSLPIVGRDLSAGRAGIHLHAELLQKRRLRLESSGKFLDLRLELLLLKRPCAGSSVILGA
jgi:hypothetical protein